VEDLVIQALVQNGKLRVYGPVAVGTPGTTSMVRTAGASTEVAVTAYGAASPSIGTSSSGVKVFAGPRDDPFFFDLTRFKEMIAAFNAQLQSVLTGFSYTSNALGMDKATFANVLVTDVLNVKTSGKTTFFDGTNVLTGRDLGDDVIDTELLLIFGGATGASNP